MFSNFNKFSICLTEKLWLLDSGNKSGLFPDDWSANTGMHQSAKEGNLEDVEMYLEHLCLDKNPGARIEGAMKGLTPTMCAAAIFGHLNAVNAHVQMYLEHLCYPGAKVEGPGKGITPMHVAAYFGHLNIVQRIQTTIGVVNPATTDGYTVLHTAASNGQLEIVQHICKDLDNKNPVATGFFNLTPIHNAANKGHLELVKFFCQIIPDITMVDSQFGFNALHFAAFNGHLEVVKFLSDIISIDIIDKNGKTACEVAKSKGHQSIFDYLRKINPNRLPNETRQQWARRRLEGGDENSYGDLISKIKDETLPELSAKFKENLAAIAGSGLPLSTKICSNYNKGGNCGRSCSYENGIHICAICVALFGVGTYHPATACETLKHLDYCYGQYLSGYT